MRRTICIIWMGSIIFGVAGLSWIMPMSGETMQSAQAQTADTAAKASEPVDVGNKICPVSGEAISEEMTKATYEYEGKIYNFCCPMCIDEFKRDPQKYLQRVEEELKAAAQEEVKAEAETEVEAETTATSESMPEGHMHEGHHH